MEKSQIEDKTQPIMYTVKQVASLLQYNHRTIHRYIYTGKIKAVKIQGSWRIPKTEVDKLLDSK